MNQAKLIADIASISEESKKTSESVLKAACAVITVALESGDDVTLPGIGKFSAKKKPARKGRNPATGEEIDIPAKTVPHFSVAKALKDAVNQA